MCQYVDGSKTIHSKVVNILCISFNTRQIFDIYCFILIYYTVILPPSGYKYKKIPQL